MTNRSLLRFALVAAPAIVACGDADSGTTGAMQQSSARPDCAPNDTACQTDGLDAPVALGARLPLDVRITARGVAAPKIALESAREDVLAVDRGAVVGKGRGWSTVLFVTPDGLVMDFVTLAVEPPDHVDVYRLTEEGASEPTPLPDRIQLAPGDDFAVAVKAWSGATRLLGELDVTWSVEGAAEVVTLLDSGRPASRRVRVREPGNVTLRMAAGGFEKALALEVLR